MKLLAKNVLFAKSKVKVVMDDESYFTLDGNEWQGHHYYDTPESVAADHVKISPTTKFPEKILVWLAISYEGMSCPKFCSSNLAVNADRYADICLPEVKNFIKKYHRTDEVIFWPDLASAHYAKKSIEKMRQLSIHFVTKDDNPPNVPQLRPIEDL